MVTTITKEIKREGQNMHNSQEPKNKRGRGGEELVLFVVEKLSHPLPL
jgi:hypothetical protein